MQVKLNGNGYTKHKKNRFTFRTVLEIVLGEMMTTPFSQHMQLSTTLMCLQYNEVNDSRV